LISAWFTWTKNSINDNNFFIVMISTQNATVCIVYYFSRKSLSKYLMDTIDFNKHDIDIFINLVKIVRYGRHCRDESCNEWRLLFWWQLSQCEIVPIILTITKICPFYYMLQANQQIIEFLFWLRNLWSQLDLSGQRIQSTIIIFL
jgi:hypothetical protein